MDRRDAPSGRDFPLQPHSGEPDRYVVALRHDDHHNRRHADHLGRHRLAPHSRRDEPGSLYPPPALDLGGRGGLGGRSALAGWACWRGNAAGLGGWTFVTRISLTTLQATGMGFFGLYGSTAALTLATAINRIGIGFQRGTHTRWQLVANDGTGAPTRANRRK